MDFQFSLSAKSIDRTNSNPNYETTNKKDNNERTKANSASDLITMERQGIKVPIGEEQLLRNIARAVKALEGPTTSLEVSIHEKTHALMVKVMNKETGELIREVPPEKTLDLVANMMEIAGILIDERV
ncbi:MULTISPECIES: flagellar protein FlaG [Paenibacillus]|uniref:Flagellar biosynthesis protein FlaG n=1 Tax=Paenibacillus odorifer TaxID=189426 RepID=A0AAD0KMZ3_9BACL|nr:flagellar protein FlaG [Paenibacillus odorifer]AWV36114.1 flagellar biosynthesis protein FlaG [Paenibacillus odorifer]OME14996.1 flagellar biosynthesis protein FlaG [Paenibacillus odorifer]